MRVLPLRRESTMKWTTATRTVEGFSYGLGVGARYQLTGTVRAGGSLGRSSAGMLSRWCNSAR